MSYKIRIFSLFASGFAGIELPSSAIFLLAGGQYASDWSSIRKNGVKLISLLISQNSPMLKTLLNDQGSSFINYQVKSSTTGACEVGDTALIIACRLGNAQGVSILLSWGADYNVQNARGYSALHAAIESYHIDCIKLLLSQWYIRVNLQNCSGDTPLILACRNYITEAVELLLELGADQYITNNFGNNAFWEAIFWKHYDCLTTLRNPSYKSNSSISHGCTAFNMVCDLIAPKQQGYGKMLSFIAYVSIVNNFAYALGQALRASIQLSMDAL